jgi:CheY-like chemotaxis protein
VQVTRYTSTLAATRLSRQGLHLPQSTGRWATQGSRSTTNECDCALVLMDVHMPVLDGFQTVEAIRKRKELAHLPVMFLTTSARRSTRSS